MIMIIWESTIFLISHERSWRQGIGKRLIDLTKEVAKGARARMMWLHVAEYNPTAISFYTDYGFQKTEVGKLLFVTWSMVDSTGVSD